MYPQPIKHRRIPRMQREAGEEAFPPLPSVPKLTKPFLIEYDSHLRGDEMRGWLWIVLGSDFDGSFCKGWPPPAEVCSCSIMSPRLPRRIRHLAPP